MKKKGTINTIKFMYWGKEDKNVCTHKDNEYYSHFSSVEQGIQHFENLGYKVIYIGTSTSSATGCYIEEYKIRFE